MMGSQFGADLGYFENLPLGKWFFLLSIHKKAVEKHNRSLDPKSSDTQSLYPGDLGSV